MKSYKIFLFIIVALGMAMNACVKDLDTTPNDPKTVTSATVFDDTAAYKQFLAKIYGSLTLTGLGTNGGYGDPDIVVPDEGTSSYLRMYWCAQELTTDEAVNGWNDGFINELHFQNWSADNDFINLMYTRIYYNVALCNEYIRDVGSRVGGLSGKLKENVTKYLAEVRFLRALSYSHALDMFQNVPFITENDGIGSFYPMPISRKDLFNYIVSELKAISPILPKPHQNEYGRADKGAIWTLLAKNYLNAKVYTGTAKNDSCVIYCDSIINGGYSIHGSFAELFMADNNKCTDEIIFPVAHDGVHTQTYGGMTYIIQAEIGGSMASADYGVSPGWGGNRVTSALVKKYDLTNDKRAMFYTNGQSLEISDIGTFKDGYAVTKFTNKTSTGGNGSSTTFVDTDFPVFRLADVYLMYAEAYLRGATNATSTKALNYVNAIRQRAYGNNSGDISLANLTLDFILDERARELLWECTRRTDLVRFGQFSNGTYVWPWKGKVAKGIATDSKYDIFPIPSVDLAANPNLSNPLGY